MEYGRIERGIIMEKIKELFDDTLQLLLEQQKEKIANDVNDILQKDKDCYIKIGYYEYDGFYYDGTINKETFDGEDYDGNMIIEQLIEYYDNLSFNVTCAIIIEFEQKEHTYYYDIEYNGYELFYDVTAPMYEAIKEIKQQFDERGEQ